VPISNAALQPVEAVIDTHCSIFVFSSGGSADKPAVSHGYSLTVFFCIKHSVFGKNLV